MRGECSRRLAGESEEECEDDAGSHAILIVNNVKASNASPSRLERVW
jgi:hypothetical protein